MTHDQIKARFPNASKSFIEANCTREDGDKACAQIQDSKSAQREKALGSGSEGKAQGAGCPLVRFTLCRVQLLDVDSKYGSVADLLDGLQYAGLVCGDREGQIILEVNQEKVKLKSDECTIIEIYE